MKINKAWQTLMEEQYHIDFKQVESVIHALPSSGFLKDTEGRYQMVSNMATYFEFEDEQYVLGKTDLEIGFDPVSAQLFFDDDRQILTGKPGKHHIKEMFLKGKQCFFEVVKNPTYDNSGKIIGIVGLINDVTERQHEELWKQNQIDMMETLTEINKLLLKIHKDDSFLNDVLKMIAGYTQSDQVTIFEFIDNQVDATFEYCTEGVQPQVVLQQNLDLAQAPYWLEHLQKNEPVMINNLESIRETRSSEYQMLKAQEITNLYVVPIISSYQSTGVLVAFLRVKNPRNLYINMHFFEHLAFGLSIAYDNYMEFHQIQRLSTYDLATNVLNRNQYIHYVHHFSAEGIKQLGCIYADVNGLHEYNNQFGHIKGDEMLNQVARLLNQHFKDEKVFRAGGDEFVIVAENRAEETLKQAIKAFETDLELQDISVAMGLEYRTEGFNIEEMLKAADAKMYDNKYQHYSEKQN